MRRYSINNGHIEEEPEGIFIRYDDIRDCLSHVVRQPHAHSPDKAQRHHEAIADLLSMLNLPPLEPVIPRDHRRVIKEIELDDAAETETEVTPVPEAPIKKRRGRPPKNKPV